MKHYKAHRRIETRTVLIWSVPENWLEEDWQPLLRQIVSVSHTVERGHRIDGCVRTSETAWSVSSSVMSAATWQMPIRGHRSIANRIINARCGRARGSLLDANKARNSGTRALYGLNCMRAASGQSITIERHRNALEL
ncbi:hypothetical protein P0D71_11100 [Paraburkholderia sp. RL17-383-BIF-A]|uniref:hypothetical protein n=1 Tax=Paraburkholderia sp. RL17-383-BIF-A TaxID=3031631 RepID=UPI0038B73185